MEKTLQFSHQDLREKRTKAGKGNGKKDDQIKVENQKKKEALEEVMKTNILK